MVENKLNFNQPILSVRKYSLSMPPHTTDDDKKIGYVVPLFRPNRPELSSGPVRNPGAIPFQWEQAPGQPKAHIQRQTEDVSCGSNDSSMEGKSSSGSFSQAGEMMMDGYEHCGEVNETVNPDKAALWYRPTFAKTCSSCNEKEVSDHHNDHKDLVSIGCLLPRSCVRSSVCVLNPAPAMSVRARLTLFSSTGVQSGSSSLDSMPEPENEGRVSSGVQTDGTKRLKTLQDLLADEKKSKELDSTTCVEKTILIDTHSNLEDKNVISTMTPNVEKQLARAKTHGNSDAKYSIIPLPRSPSDSWLRRTVTKKASAPMYVSALGNKS